MSYIPKILAFAGSMRTESFNKKLIKVAIRGAEASGAQVTQFDLRDLALPLYDGDLEAGEGLPAGARRLKELMKSHDGFMISSPEYNGSIPGVLKNAIDWASRPAPGEKSLECFKDKAVVLMSASPGAFGGMRGLIMTRSILAGIGALVLPDQVTVSAAHEAFNPDGTLKDAKKQTSVEELGKKLSSILVKLKSDSHSAAAQ
jgi:chromate reductase